MLPPGEGAESVFNETAMIGTTTSRVGNHTKKKEADPISAKSTPEAATFPTLFTNGTGGGFAHTDTGCTKNHYIHKTFGSVATHFCRAHEFVWFHFQDKVRCSTFGKSRRPMVNGHIATEADTTSLSEHTSDVEKQWELVSKLVCSEHECLPSGTTH